MVLHRPSSASPRQKSPSSPVHETVPEHTLASRPRRPWQVGAIVVLYALIGWAHLWLATGGHYAPVSASVAYYDLLGDAFLAGQLSMKVEPSPELLALPDPYDPLQHKDLRVPDLSLYNGKYYLYFAPFPGLLHAAWTAATGSHLAENFAEFVLGFGGALVFLGIVLELRARSFSKLPLGLAVVASVAYALGGVVLHIEARTIGHHEAILTSSFFALAGFWCWLRGLAAQTTLARLGQLALAGLLFAFAFGSRTTSLGYALGAGLPLVWAWLRSWRSAPIYRDGESAFLAFASLAAYAVPTLAAGLLLLLYNYLRFGSIFEFGIRYVLTGTTYLNQPGISGTFNLDVIPTNIGAYFLYVPHIIAYFPFQYRDLDPDNWPTVVWPFASATVLAPGIVLFPLGFLAFRAPRTSSNTQPARSAWQPDCSERRLAWFVAAGTVGVLFAALVVFSIVGANGRYIQDFLPVGSLIALVGLWHIYGGQFGRVLVWITSIVVLVVSTFMGVSYAFVEFSIGNAEAYESLQYKMDKLEMLVLSTIAPATWPSSYVSPLVMARPSREIGRPAGVFYPQGSSVPMQRFGTAPIQSIEINSDMGAPVAVQVFMNDSLVASAVISPGDHVLAVSADQVGDPSEVAVRLAFVEAGNVTPPYLWPLRFLRVSDRPGDKVTVP
jgi:hypothetical protein